MSAFSRTRTAALMLAVCTAGAACSSAGSPTSPPDTGLPTKAATTHAPATQAPATQAPATPVPGVLRTLDIDPRPSAIVAAANLIWVEDHAETNNVYAIDPETGQVEATIDLSRPCDFTVLDDRLWIADLETGKLVSIDLKTRAARVEVTGLRNPCGPQAKSGAIWVAVDDGIARVDTATGDTSTTSLTEGAAFPAAGLPLWAALYRSGNLIRIDPVSGKVVQSVPHPGRGAEGPALAIGFDSVWVGDAIDRVYRLDPESGAVEAEVETSAPARLLGTAAAVWLTSYNGGTVERIDPTTNKVVFRAYLGGAINGITEGLGGIWVSDTSNGRLFLLDPNATGGVE